MRNILNEFSLMSLLSENIKSWIWHCSMCMCLCDCEYTSAERALNEPRSSNNSMVTWCGSLLLLSLLRIREYLRDRRRVCVYKKSSTRAVPVSVCGARARIRELRTETTTTIDDSMRREALYAIHMPAVCGVRVLRCVGVWTALAAGAAASHTRSARRRPMRADAAYYQHTLKLAYTPHTLHSMHTYTSNIYTQRDDI